MKHLSVFKLLMIVPFICMAQWQEKASLPIDGRHHPVCVTANNLGYVISGISESGASDSFVSYEPTLDEWTELVSFPGEARGYAMGGSNSENIFIGFGVDASDNYLNDLWMYNIGAGMWMSCPNFPGAARAHPAFMVTESTIYVGLGDGPNAVNEVVDYEDWWAYDIASSTWTQLSNFIGEQRHHPYFFEIDAVFYVTCGHSRQSGVIHNDLYSYDPISDSWTQLADLPSHGRVAGTQFTYDGKGYILGGEDENHELFEAQVWAYDPQTDLWQQYPTMSGGGRWAPGSFVIDETVYVTGGLGAELYDDLWAYDLSSPLNFINVELLDISFSDGVCAGATAPVLHVQNNGLATVTSLQVNYLINGVLSGSTLWSGEIDPFGFSLVQLDVIDYVISTDNMIEIELIAVNGLADEVVDNNILSAQIDQLITDNMIWIHLRTDVYPEEFRMEVIDEVGSVVASYGPWPGQQHIEFEFPLNLPSSGCYTFKAIDEYGDGMYVSLWPDQPQNGDGNYTVLNSNLDTLHHYGGNYFFDVEETTFTVNVLDIDRVEESAIKVFPNPAKNYFEIESDSEYSEIEIISISGQSVYKYVLENKSRRVSLEGITNGIYTLVISENGNVVARKKLTVVK